MNRIINYIWLVFLILYIVSPLDAHPLFLDDVLAALFLIYLLYRNARAGRQQQDHSSQSSGREYTEQERESTSYPSLEKAYRLLGVEENSSWEKISRAYKEKMSKCHPDKVTHLSKELQDRARELSIELNEALDMIKKSRGK